MKKYLWMSSAAVVIGALRVKERITHRKKKQLWPFSVQHPILRIPNQKKGSV